MAINWKFIQKLKLGLGALPILKLRQSLMEESQLTQNYLVLTISSCFLSTFGLLINSAAVIIGAMIIAPLMSPLRGFSFATLEGDLPLLKRSSIAIIVGTSLTILGSALVGLIMGLPDMGSEILSRTQPTLIDLIIAVIAGGISGYAKIRPEIGDAIPGTAIAVALVPPICVLGLTISQGEWRMAASAGLLYATNLIGINLACLIVYVLGGYTKSNEMARTLSWSISIFLIFLLVIPLGISFWELISKARIDDSIRETLVKRSLVNRRDVKIIGLKVNWNKNPPVITVRVRAVDPITADEVKIVEQSIVTELKQDFFVVFDVTPNTLVDGDGN